MVPFKITMAVLCFQNSKRNLKKLVYELLDRSGSVLTLSYDLVLPIARYLSRHKMHDSKIYRHEFVYRPNLRGVGKPDKYYAVAFDIFSNNLPGLIASSAECIKAADEVLSTFPCFKTKNAQTFIIINHSDVLNSVIDFAFGRSQTISQSKRYELMGVLSQLGIERRHLEIVNKLGVKSKVSFCPLSNYNAKYYDGSFMFQAIHRIDKNRKFSRVATGGRYDNLIDSLTNDGLSKSRTPHGVGFQLTTTLLFWLMKNTLKRANTSDGVSKSVTKWKKVRCDVLLTCLEESIIRDSGYELLSQMWARNISCDWYISSFQENILNKAIDEGSNWIVQLRQPNLSRKKLKKGLFKPIRVKNICSNKETDVDYFELLDHLNNEIEERKNENTESIMAESSGNSGENAGELGNDQARIGEPIFNIDINQRVIVVPNAAPRGRKNNKKEKWELENDSKLASSNMMKQLASAPIITVDLTDSVLDMILTSSVQVPLEEWFKKLFFTNNKLPKSYASNIYDTLNKESAKGTPWAILHSPKTDKTTIVDLQR
ncbi:CIC11C00000005416 [Sungouiella intermedia]|uniref:CIC11C00000005416 n=1 Tax=Sungouiella intermedia TaxID=45354 RepID=A0A1L0BVI2_9ASCO|nr:CIC11C00000005416 [[Candida] intermedia]